MDATAADTAVEAAKSQAEAVGDGASAAMLETTELMGLLVDELRAGLEGAVRMLPNLVVALVVVVLFALLARVTARLVRRAGRRSRLESELVGLLGSATRIGVLAVGVFVALGVLQLEKTVTSLLAGVGVLGLALGFAFQDIAANFMAGIILAIRTPFKEGDLVETHDVTGFVRDVTLRSTLLRTFTGQNVIIPNKDVLQNTITNYSQTGERRIDLEVGVSYDDDLETAKRVAIEAIESVPERDPERDVALHYGGFGSSSIDFTVRFWLRDPVEDFLTGRSNAVMAIKKAFDAEGITIPFPIRTLDVPEREAPALAEGAPDAEDGARRAYGSGGG